MTPTRTTDTGPSLMNTRPRPAIAMPVRRLLPPSHGKAGHRDTHRPAPQLVSGRAHPELHRYNAAPCRSPKSSSDKAGTAVSSHRSPAIERTYEPRNVRQRPLITAITQLSLHLMAHQNRSTPCDRAPATTCPSPMPGSRAAHPGGRNTKVLVTAFFQLRYRRSRSASSIAGFQRLSSAQLSMTSCSPLQKPTAMPAA